MINWIQPVGETARIVSSSGKTYGLFYDSKSELRHIAEYIPYQYPPYQTLCGYRDINFSGTGMIKNICTFCEAELKKILES